MLREDDWKSKDFNDLIAAYRLPDEKMDDDHQTLYIPP
jgi:hypothetical protein